MALDLGQDNPEHDSLMIAAVADFVAVLSPTEPDTMLSPALSLESLGAYAEALTLYDSLPNDGDYWSLERAVRRSAIFRKIGEPDRALAELDTLDREHGPYSGMKYHYHRGWTLSDLGRFEEAIVQFNTGIEQQPDYAFAYARRACAHASIGRIENALDDARRALDLTRAASEVVHFESDEAQIALMEERVALLERQVAVDPRSSTAQACGWPEDQRRERSSLLQHDE